MSSSVAARPTRDHDQRWLIIASGDNSHELLQFNIEVEDFTAAARTGSNLAALIMRYEQTYTQVTLRGWRVEVLLSAPKGAWRSKSQQELAGAISSRYD